MGIVGALEELKNYSDLLQIPRLNKNKLLDLLRLIAKNGWHFIKWYFQLL